jgi:hypothetical protein
VVEKSKIIVLYLSPFLLFVAVLALLNLTSPLKIGPLGILVTFGFMYVFVALTCSIFVFLCLKGVRHFYGDKRLSDRKYYAVSATIALAPILMLALNTIGQAGLKDHLLVLSFIGVICFYILKRYR